MSALHVSRINDQSIVKTVNMHLRGLDFSLLMRDYNNVLAFKINVRQIYNI
jgi:hypothetical protein